MVLLQWWWDQQVCKCEQANYLCGEVFDASICFSFYSFSCLHSLYLGTKSAVNQAIISVTCVNTDLFLYSDALGLNFVFISTVTPV